jgi:hypothetical protein
MDPLDQASPRLGWRSYTFHRRTSDWWLVHGEIVRLAAPTAHVWRCSCFNNPSRGGARPPGRAILGRAGICRAHGLTPLGKASGSPVLNQDSAGAFGPPGPFDPSFDRSRPASGRRSRAINEHWLKGNENPALQAAARAAQGERRHALGRRATDAFHRQLADGQAVRSAARRAFRGARAAGGRRDRRRHIGPARPWAAGKVDGDDPEAVGNGYRHRQSRRADGRSKRSGAMRRPSPTRWAQMRSRW